jgi:hypothetical protein
VANAFGQFCHGYNPEALGLLGYKNAVTRNGDRISRKEPRRNDRQSEAHGVGYPSGWKTATGRLPCGRPPGFSAVSGVAAHREKKSRCMASLSDTLGSPWPPLAIRPCNRQLIPHPLWLRIVTDEPSVAFQVALVFLLQAGGFE